MRRHTGSMLLLCLLSFLKLCHAADFKDAYSLHKFVDEKYRGDDSKWKLTMTLTNKRGETRTSKLVRYRTENNNLSKTLLSYAFPPDVKGTTTLTIEREDEDDFQRIYLPAMKKIRRISSADKHKSWMGSDFNYEDLRDQAIDDFTYSTLETRQLNGEECYYYTMTPKTEDASSYGKIENWVRKDIVEAVQANYYDKKGRHTKTLKFKHLKKIQEIWTPLRLEMTNIRDRHKTDFITDRVVYNTGIENSMFTPRAMKDVPEDF